MVDCTLWHGREVESSGGDFCSVLLRVCWCRCGDASPVSARVCVQWCLPQRVVQAVAVCIAVNMYGWTDGWMDG